MHNIINAKSFPLNACGTLQELKQFLLYGMDVFRARVCCIILAKIATESFTAGVTTNGCLPSSVWSVFWPMISSLACNNPTTISLTSSGTGMWRLRGKVWQMASRTESWRSRFLATRLVTKMPAWVAEVGSSPYNLGFPATMLLPQSTTLIRLIGFDWTMCTCDLPGCYLLTWQKYTCSCDTLMPSCNSQ